MWDRILGWLSLTTALVLVMVSAPSPGALAFSPPPPPPDDPYTEIVPAWAAPLGAQAASQALPLPYLSDDDVADAPYGFAPVVDGFIAPGEYAGAGKVAFPGYAGDVEVFIRQDAITLYLAFDSPDTTPFPTASSGPAFQVLLDTHNDKATSPQPDDYRLTAQKDGVTMENRGDGAGGWSGAGTGSWTAAVYTATWGWQAEFAVGFSKLGITPGSPVSIGLGLAEVWTSSWPKDWYWPSGGFYADPSTWGDLTSSSNWSTFYWKPGPWEDYAPSGMPDFDQRQDQWISPTAPVSTHCGPVAVANSLWWFDSKFETPDHSPSTHISDTYRLITSYNPLVWDDHHPQNVIPLVNDLANNYFNTNDVQGSGAWLGTRITDMHSGTLAYLRDCGLWDDYVVTLVTSPTFEWVADEVMRSEDVILLLGFYAWTTEPYEHWARVGGHYVNVAGVNPLSRLIAFSDPYTDTAEQGGWGRVLSGTLVPHQPIPGHTPDVHNDAGNVSHDVYTATSTTSHGGVWGPEGYPWDPYWPWNPHPWNTTEPWVDPMLPPIVEVEFALTVSPFTWKSSGEWVSEDDDPVDGTWQRWIDYAPNGVPDFDQKQDSWHFPPMPAGPPPASQWTFCGPVAAANSLWWFDGKFEPGPVTPTTQITDHYPMVWSYSPWDAPWDDHDPQNVDHPATPWPGPGALAPPLPPWPGGGAPGVGEFVEDLATYFQTDMLGTGTVITNMYNGLITYTIDHGLRQGYVITQAKSPDFWWVAEEVEVSEDVILLLGFWENTGPDEWQRVGGHYLTLPGVDKQGGLVAFSDPYYNGAGFNWPYAYPGGWPTVMGRVADGWIIPHTHPCWTHVPQDHNDAGNVSHDIYYVMPTDSPGGTWGPWEYVEGGYVEENFLGQNGESGSYGGGLVQAEVDWAIAVSPVADVWVTKTVTPTDVIPGDWVTFTVEFHNEGSLPAEDVVLTDTFPDGLTNRGWTYWVSNGLTVTWRPGSKYVWDLPDLSWKEWGLITVTAQVDADLDWSALLVLTNPITISTSSVEQYQVTELPNAASAGLTVRTADLGISKTVAPTDTLSTGDWVTFTLVYSNAGPAPVHNVVITDLLSARLLTATAGFTYTTSYGGLLTDTDHYVWQAGTVPAGGKGMITVTAQLTTTLGASFRNDVAIAGWWDRSLGNNQGGLTVPISGAFVYLPLVLRNYP